MGRFAGPDRPANLSHALLRRAGPARRDHGASRDAGADTPSASVAEEWREPESGQDRRVEARHRRDLVAGQGEDHEPDRVIARGVRVADIEAERGLAVRPGRDEPGGAESRHQLIAAEPDETITATGCGCQKLMPPGQLPCGMQSLGQALGAGRVDRRWDDLPLAG